MNIIRKLAVYSYRKKLIHFTDTLSNMNEKQIAHFLIWSVWIRSYLQVEGHINPMKRLSSSSDDINLDPELHAYPLMLEDIDNFVNFLVKQNQKSKAAALMLWVHTIRSIIRPELNSEINNLWRLIMKTKAYWNDEIHKQYEEAIKVGVKKDFVEKTEKLAQEILKCLPPKQILKKP